MPDGRSKPYLYTVSPEIHEDKMRASGASFFRVGIRLGRTLLPVPSVGAVAFRQGLAVLRARLILTNPLLLRHPLAPSRTNVVLHGSIVPNRYENSIARPQQPRDYAPEIKTPAIAPTAIAIPPMMAIRKPFFIKPVRDNVPLIKPSPNNATMEATIDTGKARSTGHNV